jgi:hypothetical protein
MGDLADTEKHGCALLYLGQGSGELTVGPRPSEGPKTVQSKTRKDVT